MRTYLLYMYMCSRMFFLTIYCGPGSLLLMFDLFVNLLCHLQQKVVALLYNYFISRIELLEKIFNLLASNKLFGIFFFIEIQLLIL
jgi:hypothetical protein